MRTLPITPMWHSTIFAPYFVAGAIYSGIAAIILVAAISRWVEWSMMAGLSAGFVLALILFTKFFPIISIWETEKEDREK
ncbi:MAG: hypothetical protein COS40_11770 [Deltaproteobacteria bacterium CG03_land_8_20_14_0_80_45_14]|nr:MAG: hypothetical protein COS40_11770 [Deltaproteobacteria bacterium CG03_land_8_20_14_0_80_45_14]